MSRKSPFYSAFFYYIFCGHIIEALRLSDKKLSVRVNGEIRLIDLKSILYVETVERNSFIYTECGVFESQLRLYELEAMLAEHNFIRVNKSTLVNLNMIESLKSDIDRRIRVTLNFWLLVLISYSVSTIISILVTNFFAKKEDAKMNDALAKMQERC